MLVVMPLMVLFLVLVRMKIVASHMWWMLVQVDDPTDGGNRESVSMRIIAGVNGFCLWNSADV